MTARPSVVIDTSVLVSGLLRSGSIPFLAIERAFLERTILSSMATRAELVEVLHRPKFTRYFSPADLELYLRRVVSRMELVPITHAVAACRDPKDDKFLELALSGGASMIVSSDIHLLEMHPFRGIDILKPEDYLQR